MGGGPGTPDGGPGEGVVLDSIGQWTALFPSSPGGTFSAL